MNKYFNRKLSVLLIISLFLGTNTAFAATTRSDHQITKYDIRADFNIAATLSKGTLPIASDELKHSLQDNPSNRVHNSSSAAAKKIASATEYATILKEIKKKLSSSKKTVEYGASSTAFNDNKDLYLAYHNMDYSYTATKSNGKWKISITFTDIYDYDMKTWKKYGTSAIIKEINNYGAAAQSLGAIVPFNIAVNMPYVYY